MPIKAERDVSGCHVRLKFLANFPCDVCPTCKQIPDLAVVTRTVPTFFCPPGLGRLPAEEKEVFAGLYRFQMSPCECGHAVDSLVNIWDTQNAPNPMDAAW